MLVVDARIAEDQRVVDHQKATLARNLSQGQTGGLQSQGGPGPTAFLQPLVNWSNATGRDGQPNCRDKTGLGQHGPDSQVGTERFGRT